MLEAFGALLDNLKKIDIILHPDYKELHDEAIKKLNQFFYSNRAKLDEYSVEQGSSSWYFYGWMA